MIGMLSGWVTMSRNCARPPCTSIPDSYRRRRQFVCELPAPPSVYWLSTDSDAVNAAWRGRAFRRLRSIIAIGQIGRDGGSRRSQARRAERPDEDFQARMGRDRDRALRYLYGH